jgi:hypothetical protein
LIDVAHIERWREYECHYSREVNEVGAKEKRKANRKERRRNGQAKNNRHRAWEGSKLSAESLDHLVVLWNMLCIMSRLLLPRVGSPGQH